MEEACALARARGSEMHHDNQAAPVSGAEADHPHVLVFPPLLVAGTLAAGLLLHALDPHALVPRSLRFWIGVPLFIAGVALGSWGHRVMKRAGTNVNPSRPVTRLVTGGPFRLSRNPLYVSIALVYAGIACSVNALWLGILFIPLLVVLHLGVIAREERFLEARFGDEYRTYRARVRRWV